MQTLLESLTTGIAIGSLYALIALGYTLVYGILSFINFAHSDIFSWGAWISVIIAIALGNHMAHGNVANLTSSQALLVGLTSLTAAVVLCGLLGFLIERFAYRPLRDAPRLNVLITAIGISLLLQNVGQLQFHRDVTVERVVKGELKQVVEQQPTAFPFGQRPKSIPDLVSQEPLFTFAGVKVSKIDTVVFVTAVTLMIAIQWLVYGTKIGLAMRAVAFNHRTAALMGIDVDRIISFTFVLGSMLAAAAGFLYAVKYSNIRQAADSTWVLLGLKAFVAAVVGGIGNVRGAMLGGLFIGVSEILGTVYISASYRDVYVFLILIAVLLLRPSGLLGKAVVEKV